MKKIMLLAFAGIMALQGCAPLIIGGAATGAGVIQDRRSAGTVVDDNTAEIAIANAISKHPELADNSNISTTVYAGEVLLTGEAYNDTVRTQVESIARNHAGIHQVYNYVLVGRPSTLSERGYDTKQTAKVKTALFDVSLPGFNPSRVKVVTAHGITYLMGLVSTQEAQAASQVASRVSGVKQVVTLFQIRQ